MIKIPRGLMESEKSLYIAAYNKCIEIRDSQDLDISAAIELVVQLFNSIISDPIQLNNFLLAEISAEIEPVLWTTTEELRNSKWWKNLLKDEEFSPEYWTRYKNYLQSKESWSLNAIREIDYSTDELMNVIANPTLAIEQERLGMIFGYVQSGKTAHYIALINKAIDAGYKYIIVLSGIHNNLRSQTQSRIDEEVLGYETSNEKKSEFLHVKNAIGVGIGKNNTITNMVQSLTTRDNNGDFNSKVAGTSMSPPFIIVTKKNAKVLEHIIEYFKKSPLSDDDGNQTKFMPAELPALIIDDEADQASINTKECYDEKGQLLENYNPSTINGLIRKLLKLFRTRTYIGYTATPFANIFIPPNENSVEHGTDLYPRDFIFKIPRAELYVGAKEFFGLTGSEEAPAMPLCRSIIEGRSFLGQKNKQNDPIGELPNELKYSIYSFLISTAIRNCRGQINQPNTMLIHIVRFVKQQNIIKRKVEKFYKDEIANLIIYKDAEFEQILRDIWLNDYVITTEAMKNDFPKYVNGLIDFEWSTIFEEIYRIVYEREITIYSVNGKSTDALIYKNHKGKPFNVIVIGGDKLSRGLTLEGLTVSYFTRASNMYDTLMQMGRWFGYRPGYLDLCRLFTTPTLRKHFLDISIATEDLANQFEFMNDVNQTPMTFGLRVATHPDLLITSSNKLKSGKELNKDFSNHLTQTRSFDIDPEQHNKNFIAVETLLNSIGNRRDTNEYWSTKGRSKIGEHYFWTEVPGYHISNFLLEFETSEKTTRANSKYMADYILDQNKNGGLVEWTVCLINTGDENGKFTISGQNVKGGIKREKGIGIPSNEMVSIKNMTSEGHEYLDYTKQQISLKDEIIEKYIKSSNITLTEKIRSETRDRQNGLLILYPIGTVPGFTDVLKDCEKPFGFAIVFPNRQGIGTLTSYRVTEIGIERENYELFE